MKPMNIINFVVGITCTVVAGITFSKGWVDKGIFNSLFGIMNFLCAFMVRDV